MPALQLKKRQESLEVLLPGACRFYSNSIVDVDPFAMHGKRISKYTILRVMKMLRNPRTTFSYAAKEVGINVMCSEGKLAFK